MSQVQTIPADPSPFENEAKQERSSLGRRVCKRYLRLWQLWTSHMYDANLDASWTSSALPQGALCLSLQFLHHFGERILLLMHGKIASGQVLCLRHRARRLHADVMPLFFVQVPEREPCARRQSVLCGRRC
jgi:hypothetical protein